MQIFSQNGPWSVPNKQNPSFYSIFHAFSRSKFPPVWPFPFENPYRPLLSIILSYRNIPSFNISILGLFLPPLIRIGSDQHGTHTGPTRVQHGSMLDPCWVQHGSMLDPCWVQHGYQRDHCGPGSPRDHCGPGPQPNPKWNFFRGLYP